MGLNRTSIYIAIGIMKNFRQLSLLKSSNINAVNVLVHFLGYEL
jgi:uncharacterized protein YkvS